PLNLKPFLLGVTKRKKKKKDKDKAKLLEAMGTSKKNEEEKRRGLDKRTPAQAAFEKMQEKRQMERILKKASKTHKQRVEDFNGHLDTLTEHCDIPKVSWTKQPPAPGWSSIESSPEAPLGLCVFPLVYSRHTALHTPSRLLLQTALRSCAPSFWNLIKVKLSF
uniref:Protein FAM32A n=1 Tax=Cebus imitator TaxID=2715852 RepID=A0A2K5QYB6_CEBIM